MNILNIITILNCRLIGFTFYFICNCECLTFFIVIFGCFIILKRRERTISGFNEIMTVIMIIIINYKNYMNILNIITILNCRLIGFTFYFICNCECLTFFIVIFGCFIILKRRERTISGFNEIMTVLMIIIINYKNYINILNIITILNCRMIGFTFYFICNCERLTFCIVIF